MAGVGRFPSSLEDLSVRSTQTVLAQRGGRPSCIVVGLVEPLVAGDQRTVEGNDLRVRVQTQVQCVAQRHGGDGLLHADYLFLLMLKLIC